MKNTNRWLSWGILVFGFVVVFFHRLSIGSVADQLTVDLKLDSIQIANLASMTFYGYALMQLPVGIMVDTLGVRRICTIGMFVTAVGSILFGIAGHVYIAYFARFLVGIGTSVIIVSVMKIQSTLFPPNMYSTLSGLTSLFGNFGAFFATIPLSFIAVNFGWRGTFIILGLISIALSLGIHFFVKERISISRFSSEFNGINEENLNASSNSADNNLSSKIKHSEEVTAKNKAAKKVNLETESERINIKEAVRFVLTNKAIYPNFLIMVFFVGSLTAVLGLWGNGYMKTVYQISNEKAAFYLSFITYGFIVGAPIVGKLSDLLGGVIKNIMVFASAGYVLIWSYVLILQKGKPPIEQWPIIYFIMGMLIICHILVFSNVKDNNPLKYTGIATSLVNIGEFVGSGIISLLMGLMIKRLKLSGMPLEMVYTTAMILVLGSAVLSFMAVLFMREGKAHQQIEASK
ncbi:MAG: hypothetical protein BGO41_00675 [Clostridiales bacterium 38-18]|nr:MAG: hypothetical protein BGO41_00675 [Clostridiales bacterium 38-18]